MAPLRGNKLILMLYFIKLLCIFYTDISCIGKSSNTPEKRLLDKYLLRIGKKIQIIEIGFKNQKIKKYIEDEGKKIIDTSPENSALILLDKTGKNFTTEELAMKINQFEKNNIKIINFAIGGPYGHGEAIKKKANIILSFGKMTWPHLMARVMIVEQLYRVETIFNNHPYHKI